MLVLKVELSQEVNPKNDPLGRSEIGYRFDMTDAELFEATRGVWRLGKPAERETVALVTLHGEVLLVVEINRLVQFATTTRRAIEGRIVQPGEPLYDEWMGRMVTVGHSRNPVAYLPNHPRLCRCGCGLTVDGAHEFATGHDLKALQTRVKKIGSVAQFLDWFDARWEEVGSRPDGCAA